MNIEENRDYIAHISDVLTYREKLEAVAEEAAELSKAALKIIRAYPGYSRNTTPKPLREAIDDFNEEVLDLFSALYIVTDAVDKEKMLGYWKWERWAKRLGYKEDEQ